MILRGLNDVVCCSLLKTSREYRAVIKACELDLKSQLSKCLLLLWIHTEAFCILINYTSSNTLFYTDFCHDEIAAEEMKSELSILSVIELIWNLAEVLFVETLAG